MELAIQLIALLLFGASITNDIVSGGRRGSIANLGDINSALEKISTLEMLRQRETDARKMSRPGTDEIKSFANRERHIQSLIDQIAVPLPKINTYHGEYDGFTGPFNVYSQIRMAMDNPINPSWVRDGISCRICASLTIYIVSSIILLISLLHPIAYTIYIGVALRGLLVYLYSYNYHIHQVSAGEW